MIGAFVRGLPALCMLAASACSLVGSSDFRIVEGDAGVDADAGGLRAIDASSAAGGAEAVAPEPAPSCPYQSLCVINADCCGYAEGRSLCVTLGPGSANRCFAVCTSSEQCVGDDICHPTSGGDSVCAPP